DPWRIDRRRRMLLTRIDVGSVQQRAKPSQRALKLLLLDLLVRQWPCLREAVCASPSANAMPITRKTNWRGKVSTIEQPCSRSPSIDCPLKHTGTRLVPAIEMSLTDHSTASDR